MVGGQVAKATSTDKERVHDYSKRSGQDFVILCLSDFCDYKKKTQENPLMNRKDLYAYQVWRFSLWSLHALLWAWGKEGTLHSRSM